MPAKITSPNDPRVQQYIGIKFNRLTAIRFVEMKSFAKWTRTQIWEFKCDCGNNLVAILSNVKRGITTSCGCFAKEKSTSHGFSCHPMYRSWDHMIQRCTNPKSDAWGYYGGRGITVCDRWLTFSNFLADMKDGHSEGLTIERMDNSMGYSKENCRWASRAEQSRNKRTSRKITFNDRTLNLTCWAREIGISSGHLKWRIDHWPIERALAK